MCRRAVIEIDHVGAVRSCVGMGAQGADARPNRHPVLLEGCADCVRVAWVIGWRQAGTRLDDCRGHLEPSVDLGEFAAGWPATQDQQALRKITGEGRVVVGPGQNAREPIERRRPGDRTDSYHNVPRVELMACPSCLTLTRPRPVIVALPR